MGVSCASWSAEKHPSDFGAAFSRVQHMGIPSPPFGALPGPGERRWDGAMNAGPAGHIWTDPCWPCGLRPAAGPPVHLPVSSRQIEGACLSHQVTGKGGGACGVGAGQREGGAMGVGPVGPHLGVLGLTSVLPCLGSASPLPWRVG